VITYQSTRQSLQWRVDGLPKLAMIEQALPGGCCRIPAATHRDSCVGTTTAAQRAIAPYLVGKNMGDIIHIECGHCHQRQDFMLGVGMVYSSLENVLDCIPVSERSDVARIRAEHQVQATDFAHRLYHCRGCHRLYERFHLRIEYDLDQFFAITHHCRKCSSLLESVSVEDVPSLPCAGCGQLALAAKSDGVWD
jgi:hypothetical protein